MGKKSARFGAVVSLNYYISKKLKSMGITGDYLAFYFLHDILELLINDGISVKSFSREVFPRLAAKYGVEACTIERDIRNLIKSLWEKSLKGKLKDYWHSEKHPTCIQFIYLVKSYILEEIT